MPPLNRQDSRLSIHSWWSDSNSLLVYGPTINLHAAAKPLMRLMYHRQALNIIRNNLGVPLTTTMLETYSSYFPWDYVSWGTKAAILSELADRVKSSEVEARAIVDSLVFRHILSMLGSPDPRTRRSSCSLLGNLTSRKSTASAVLKLEPCKQLVSLLSDIKHADVIREATYTLSQIAHLVDGAKGVVDAKAVAYVLPLFRSSDSYTRRYAYELAGHLASHESTAPAILKVNPSVQLVSLLGENFWATYALSQIARWLDGAKAVVDAKATRPCLAIARITKPGDSKMGLRANGKSRFPRVHSTGHLEVKPFCAACVLAR
ncbi:hypothetical protein B0H14DRAFT_1571852 [Mycena olivaceomarginata]|nr:hypothetical protein B0H14DRAFT_1571852 [Mycena olivaceomarginata]